MVADTRPGAKDATRLFGYTWNAATRDGVRPANDTLLEAVSSRRSLVVTTLPEAWLIAIGAAGAEWQEITRDLVADLRRAYPGVPLDAFEVVGITIQSDSDESRGTTDVYLDEKRTQVLDRQTGLLRRFDKNLEKTARQYAVTEVQRAARLGGIEREANERAREQLGNLLKTLGYKEVEVLSTAR